MIIDVLLVELDNRMLIKPVLDVNCSNSIKHIQWHIILPFTPLNKHIANDLQLYNSIHTLFLSLEWI